MSVKHKNRRNRISNKGQIRYRRRHFSSQCSLIVKQIDFQTTFLVFVRLKMCILILTANPIILVKSPKAIIIIKIIDFTYTLQNKHTEIFKHVKKLILNTGMKSKMTSLRLHFIRGPRCAFHT